MPSQTPSAGHSQPDNALSLLSSTDSDPSQSHGISTPWKPASGTAGGRGHGTAGRLGRTDADESRRAWCVDGSEPSRLHTRRHLRQRGGASGAGRRRRGRQSERLASRKRLTGPRHGVRFPDARRPLWKYRRRCERPARHRRRVVGRLNLRRLAWPRIDSLFPHQQRLGAIAGDISLFPLYVLDVNDGVVLFPGVDQLANPGGSVILQAQVSGTTVSSYNWNTSALSSDATSIAGSTTFQLTFQWNNSIATAHVDAITLSVTDSNSHIETYTYDFQLLRGGSGTSGNATWPQSFAPDTIGAGRSGMGQRQCQRRFQLGRPRHVDPVAELQPQRAGERPDLRFADGESAADHHRRKHLSSSSAVPSQVSATLTFNGTVGTTYYYNTSTLNPGDVQQIALQATSASSLATGRYSYSMQIVDHGTSLTTITYSGTATVINQSSSAFGDGWTLDGLEQITSASGGVILNEGGGGDSLWFAGSFGSGGGTYTTPAGDFSTLVLNSNGSYTRTLPTATRSRSIRAATKQRPST